MCYNRDMSVLVPSIYKATITPPIILLLCKYNKFFLVSFITTKAHLVIFKLGYAKIIYKFLLIKTPNEIRFLFMFQTYEFPNSFNMLL